ncbi:transposable element Tcb1 transposase [Trichonephila clavipes]|uniref:Transposable element Tcb1 transposase n=1 Tax=Trichonephila clavipes TaxID=2585209 RepID=A0A8X6RQI1_TRICX|nr:transposable element Tcb1 transposase [Trichonephila clavipes]
MKTKLTEEVVAKILPVYQRLASNKILSRCTSGKSQNANESLHSVIWSHCPKESFQSKKRLEISVVTAVSEFNFGSLFTLKHVHQNALLPSMQISGVRDERRLKQSRRNHQMAWIIRYNDKSVREGCIRNGGKEVKLFTSALKAFQCNNRLVTAQRKHLDDFLRGRIVGRLECGRTQQEVSEELGIAQSVISRF